MTIPLRPVAAKKDGDLLGISLRDNSSHVHNSQRGTESPYKLAVMREMPQIHTQLADSACAHGHIGVGILRNSQRAPPAATASHCHFS